MISNELIGLFEVSQVTQKHSAASEMENSMFQTYGGKHATWALGVGSVRGAWVKWQEEISAAVVLV